MIAAHVAQERCAICAGGAAAPAEVAWHAGCFGACAMVAINALNSPSPWLGALGAAPVSPFGLDEFLNPDRPTLRQDELSRLAGGINGTDLGRQQLQAIMGLMMALRAMPPEDLLALLMLLDPAIRQRLAEAIANGNLGGGAAAPGASGGGGAMPAMPSAPAARAPAARGPGGAASPSTGGATGAAPVGPAPGGTASGQKLAQAAAQIAGSRNTTGWCYRGVADAVRQSLGVSLTGGSAYMAADQLASNPRFKEVKVSPDELKKLPPGAIVVWDRTSASPHGHISVALGDGREASDHIQQQMTSLRGAQNYRVFIPQ